MKLSGYDSAQVDQYTGAMRLTLPRRLALKLSDVFDAELAPLPPDTARELKQNLLGQIALTLKSSRTAEIYEAETVRLKEQQDTEARMRSFLRLQQAKERNSKHVLDLELATYSHKTTPEALHDIRLKFLDQVSDDPDATLLFDWATDLAAKRRRIRQ